MQNAIPRVGAFARKLKLSADAIEGGAPFDELLDGPRTIVDENVDGFAVGQSVAGDERVLFVQFHFVVVAERGCDAALRVFGRGFLERIFRDHQDFACLRQFDRGAKSGDACTNNEEIRVHGGDGRFPPHGTTVDMPAFRVETANRSYDAVVERGALRKLSAAIPDSAGVVFVVTTRDVWDLHGSKLVLALDGRPHHVLYFVGGEPNKRIAHVEEMAEQMVELGADRSSLIVAFGGGIVTDLGGFLAAVFMRGIPLIQIPTTLLAQVDAAVGGKTGANLAGGKNLIGSFHQPLTVLIDPDVLATLSEREYRAGLYEIIKCGIIRDRALFSIFALQRDEVLARQPEIEERIIAAAVRIKCEVVTADEREGDLRRILNFGHTVGHAIEAATKYATLLHGEAVAYGMFAAIDLSREVAGLTSEDATEMRGVIESYGALPSLKALNPQVLADLTLHDKKTVKGKVHFVLTPKVGETKIVSGVAEPLVLRAIEAAIG